jgi:tetratricopeptide (TPR) repeat protein
LTTEKELICLPVMAVPIEGYSVVAQFSRIQRLLDDGSLKIPNATVLSDTHIWKCSFMALDDARKFLQVLEKSGLNGSRGPDSDVVIATEFDRSVEPYCEWLKMAVWEKAVIAWMEGTRPDTVIAREGWDPKVGSGLIFHDQSTMHFIEFLRLENGVEVFLNKKTGKEVYVGRTSTSVDALFKSASEIVRKHFVNPGEPSVSGAAAQEVLQAVSMLEEVVAETPDWWNAQWFYGKSQMALGNYHEAYEAFRSAYRVEKNVESILRELAGVCLELRRFDEAVEVAQAAVTLDPGNAELLGNLAVAFLLAGQLVPARKAINAATKFNPNDRINQVISRVLGEIETGRREQPQSLRDLTKPLQPKRWAWFKRFWK